MQSLCSLWCCTSVIKPFLSTLAVGLLPSLFSVSVLGAQRDTDNTSIFTEVGYGEGEALIHVSLCVCVY